MFPLEICATVAGVAYLYYAVRQRALCWVYYIVSALAYVPVFLNSGFYLYAIFQLLFMLAGLTGLLLWGHDETDSQKLKRMTIRGHALYNLTSMAVLIPGVILLPRSNGLVNAISDCFLSVYTLSTTILTTRKYIENWLYWILVNAVGIGAALSNHLFATAVFFLINLIFAVIGYREWRQEMKRQQFPDVHRR